MPWLEPEVTKAPAQRRTMPVALAALLLACLLGSSLASRCPAASKVVAFGELPVQNFIPPEARTNVRSVAVGVYGYLSLLNSGRTVLWGQGNAPFTPRNAAKDVVAVAASEQVYLALLKGGRLVPLTDVAPKPDTVYPDASTSWQDIPVAAQKDVAAVYVAPGGTAVAITRKGDIISWGGNFVNGLPIPAAAQRHTKHIAFIRYVNGQQVTVAAFLLDDGTVVTSSASSVTSKLPSALKGQKVVALAASADHFWAGLQDGRVVEWSYTEKGASPVIHKSVGKGRITAITPGFALLTDGTLATFSSAPAELLPHVTTGIAAIWVVAEPYVYRDGKPMGLLLTTDGKLVGFGAEGGAYVPAFVPKGLGNVVRIVAGNDRAAAIDERGKVTAWGGTSGTSETLVLAGAVDVAFGQNYSMAVMATGNVIAWTEIPGAYEYSGPAVGALSGVISVSISTKHTLALKKDGSVVCLSDTYKHGKGVKSPCSIEGQKGRIVQVAAGFASTFGLGYSLALFENGRVGYWPEEKPCDLSKCDADYDNLDCYCQLPAPLPEDLASGKLRAAVIATGNDHAACLLTNGSIYVFSTWYDTDDPEPQPFLLLKGAPAISLAVYGDGVGDQQGENLVARLNDGRVYTNNDLLEDDRRGRYVKQAAGAQAVAAGANFGLALVAEPAGDYTKCDKRAKSAYRMTGPTQRVSKGKLTLCWEVRTNRLPASSPCRTPDLDELHLDLGGSCTSAALDVSFNGAALPAAYLSHALAGSSGPKVLKVAKPCGPKTASSPVLASYAQITSKPATLCVTVKASCTAQPEQLCRAHGSACRAWFISADRRCCPTQDFVV